MAQNGTCRAYMFRTTGQALWPWQLFESGCSWGWPTKMQLVKYEWEKVQHAFLVTQYQVHGHASFAVMHANRSACTDKLTGELQLCLYIYIYRESYRHPMNFRGDLDLATTRDRSYSSNWRCWRPLKLYMYYIRGCASHFELQEKWTKLCLYLCGLH